MIIKIKNSKNKKKNQLILKNKLKKQKKIRKIKRKNSNFL